MNDILSVSIVLYKTPVEDIRNCLRSLSLSETRIHLYVVDNSPDMALKAELSGPHISYVHMPHNPGYGAAHNVALRQSAESGYRYHLVLNADISFETDVLTPLVRFMDENPNVAHVMPLVCNPDGTIQRLCKLVPTPVDLLFRRFLPGKLRARANERFELHQSGYDRVMFVPYLSGCFMMLRNSALKQVGYFDERFFMYPEDIDLTRRIANNYDTLFVPIVSVVHGHGAESSKSLKMFVIHAMNMVKYFNKWGWFFDRDRDLLNIRTLEQLSSHQE